MSSKPDKVSWLERPIFPALPFFTCELCIFAIILILTTVSRLYNLGARVISHDESLHVYYSWLFSNGFGYQHTPTTHGPLQFHLISLIFTLFGDNDFTARLPHALASILTVFMIWKWRRYLGRAGSLLTAGLLLLSPFMLYYGRYARNESFVALLGVMTLYAILRYLETGKHKYLLLLTVVTSLHFATKETAFIYTAQAMLFLAFCIIRRVSRSPWQKASLQNVFVLLLVLSILLLSLAFGVNKYTGIKISETDIVNTSPQIPGSSLPVTGLTPKISSVTSLFIFACIGLLICGDLIGHRVWLEKPSPRALLRHASHPWNICPAFINRHPSESIGMESPRLFIYLARLESSGPLESGTLQNRNNFIFADHHINCHRSSLGLETLAEKRGCILGNLYILIQQRFFQLVWACDRYGRITGLLAGPTRCQ